jgi:hypothetical protein
VVISFFEKEKSGQRASNRGDENEGRDERFKENLGPKGFGSFINAEDE